MSAPQLTPLDVGCPDCTASPGVPCHIANPDLGTEHAARRDTARLRAVEHGTCSRCGQWMVRGAQDEGGPLTAWHPDTAAAALCPPMADATTDWNTYAAQINAGLSPGHPGLECFQLVPTEAVEHAASMSYNKVALPEPVDPPNAICPDCLYGKHPNCNGQAWDHVNDDVAPCTCTDPHHTDRTTTP